MVDASAERWRVTASALGCVGDSTGLEADAHATGRVDPAVGRSQRLGETGGWTDAGRQRRIARDLMWSRRAA